MAARSGFTFVELLVVIAIISALAGIALSGLAVLRRQQKVASTVDLMTHITTAIDQYVRDYRRLGNGTSSDFINDPWDFLCKRHLRLKQPPLIEIPLARLVTKTGPNSAARAESSLAATHITDHFGSTPANVFSFTILNNSKRGAVADDSFTYAQCILLRSSAGTAGEPKDDIIYGFNSEKAAWRKLRVEELEKFAEEIDRSPIPVFETKWTDPLGN